jgi:hypothetical protein
VRYTVLYALLMALGRTYLPFVQKAATASWMERGLHIAMILLPMAGMGVVLELFLSDEPERRFTSLLQSRGARAEGAGR